jgi:hypothetical protein
MSPNRTEPLSEDAILDFFARCTAALLADFEARFAALPPPPTPSAPILGPLLRATD